MKKELMILNISENLSKMDKQTVTAVYNVINELSEDESCSTLVILDCLPRIADNLKKCLMRAALNFKK